MRGRTHNNFFWLWDFLYYLFTFMFLILLVFLLWVSCVLPHVLILFPSWCVFHTHVPCIYTVCFAKCWLCWSPLLLCVLLVVYNNFTFCPIYLKNNCFLNPTQVCMYNVFGMTKMNVESFENIFFGDGLTNEWSPLKNLRTYIFQSSYLVSIKKFLTTYHCQ